MIGVKQEFPLSPTLFLPYIDEGSNYIERLSSEGACLVQIAALISLYADDFVLISDSLGELQRHLDALKPFCEDGFFAEP